MSENIIKSITKHKCPSCDTVIFVENQFAPPAVGALFTEEAVEEAKKDCLERVETLTIEDEKKEAVKKWILDPSTIFSPEEVESIVLSLLEPKE